MNFKYATAAGSPLACVRSKVRLPFLIITAVTRLKISVQAYFKPLWILRIHVYCCDNFHVDIKGLQEYVKIHSVMKLRPSKRNILTSIGKNTLFMIGRIGP